MTAAIERALYARLDLSAAWRGDRADPRCLLADRPSGMHALTRGDLYHGTNRGDMSREGLLLACQSRTEARQQFKALTGHHVAECDHQAAAMSARMKLIRAGVRWSNSPAALRSRKERERLARKRQNRGQA